MLPSLYDTHYPACIHKIPTQQLIQVKQDLIDSYVDDLHTGATLYDIELEYTQHTFCHDLQPNFHHLTLKRKGELITISKGLKILQVLDFSGFKIKKFNSCSLFVQNQLNSDNRLSSTAPTHTKIRPDQSHLKDEILESRQKSTEFANIAPPDHPEIKTDHYHYLGMVISRTTDEMALRSKPILLCSKIKGRVDIMLHNAGEFDMFLASKSFTKAHLAALVSAIYCPQFHLNAVYSNVAKKVTRYVHLNSPDTFTWKDKIDPSLHGHIKKLAKLYFLVQHLQIPRFCMAEEYLMNQDFFLVASSDGSADFS